MNVASSSETPQRATGGSGRPPELARLDPLDLRILAELQEDSRRTYAEIAARVGLSAPSVHDRVKKLEARGIVRGHRAVLDADRLGFGVLAFVAVVQEMASDWEAISASFAAVPEILECHHVAGAEDFLLKVRARNTRDLERILNCIQQSHRVVTTRTVVVLSSAFSDRPLPLGLAGDPVAGDEADAAG